MVGRLSLSLVALGLVAAAHAQLTAKEVFREASPSVITIVCLDAEGEAESSGTGFYVAPNLVATNHHVVADALKLVAWRSGTDDEVQVNRILAMDAKRDLALIEVGTRGKPLVLATADDAIEVGETVYVIGNPLSQEATLSSGLVSQLRYSSDPKQLQISAPISPGSSGGPVLTPDGHVVGVATSYLAGGQNLNFAVHASHVRDLMNAPITNPARPRPTPGGRVLKGLTLDSATAILEDLGYTVEPTDFEGTLMATSDKVAIGVELVGDDEGSGHPIAKLYSAWNSSLRPNDLLERINAWNRDFRFTRAYMDDDNDPVIRAEYVVGSGCGRAAVENWVRLFMISAETFSEEPFEARLQTQLATVQASQSAGLLHLVDADEVEQMLIDLEYEPTRKETAAGEPYFSFDQDGVKTILFLYDKSDNGQYASLQLYAGWVEDRTRRSLLGLVNGFNASTSLSKGYVDDEDDPVLESDLSLTGGATLETIQVWISMFPMSVADFKAQVLGKG